MNEDSLFDDIARILASPMPRRQALRRILGGLAGAALARSPWPGRAQAAPETARRTRDCGIGLLLLQQEGLLHHGQDVLRLRCQFHLLPRGRVVLRQRCQHHLLQCGPGVQR